MSSLYKIITKILCLVFCVYSSHMHAEGTKQLAPSSADRIYLHCNDGSYNNFGRYDGDDGQRLYIHIENPNTEQVYLGFSQAHSSGHYPCREAVTIPTYFRIKDPTGRVVFPIIDNNNGQILDATTSNITSYAQAVNGPTPIAGTGGYTPFVFDPNGLPAGDYYVEFSRSINNVSTNNPMSIECFDITVATKTATPAPINGRLFSRNWALFAPSISCGEDVTYNWFDRAFNGAFYVYTDENIVTLVDFNGAGFQPGAFNAVFNDAGTTQTGNVIEDRKSLNDVQSSAFQHRIFLNDPDINVYPTGVLGEITITPRYLACDNGTACVEAVMTEPGQIDVLIDLDTTTGRFVYDLNSKDVLIAFKVEPALGELPPYRRCVPWDGKDGFGKRVGDSLDINDVVLLTRYTQGIYHFPIYDAEFMLNGYDITTIRPIPNNGSPKKIYYDDANIPDSYGPSINQPKENPFNGCETPCHPWTNIEFGDENTINSWFFAREEYIVQVDSGGCPIVAKPDSIVMFVNTMDDIDILINDLGTDKIDTTSIGINISPNNGVAVFDSVNLIAIYTPTPGFVGVDTFEYEFCYGIPPVRSLCHSTEVYVTVLPLPEDCTNTHDDDGDGLADCDDPDCLPMNAPIKRKQNGVWWIIIFLGCGLIAKTLKNPS